MLIFLLIHYTTLVLLKTIWLKPLQDILDSSCLIKIAFVDTSRICIFAAHISLSEASNRGE